MKNLLKIKALLIAFLATYKISYATALPMDDYSFLYYKPPFYVTVIKSFFDYIDDNFITLFLLIMILTIFFLAVSQYFKNQQYFKLTRNLFWMSFGLLILSIILYIINDLYF